MRRLIKAGAMLAAVTLAGAWLARRRGDRELEARQTPHQRGYERALADARRTSDHEHPRERRGRAGRLLGGTCLSVPGVACGALVFSRQCRRRARTDHDALGYAAAAQVRRGAGKHLKPMNQLS